MSIPWESPKPGCTIKVIGAGLPRTGLHSFGAAVGTLLNGPPYGAGVQWAGVGAPANERCILTTLEVARSIDKPPAEKEKALTKLRDMLDGYVTTLDVPLTLMVPELMELYPDAKVICTLRDRDTWAESIWKVVQGASPAFAGFLFFWVRSARHSPKLNEASAHTFDVKFGKHITDLQSAKEIYNQHQDWLREIVPRDKLFFINVKDGWEPLCKVLDMPVPDVPFPRLNDAEDIQKHFEALARKGLTAWAIVGGITVCLGSVLYMLARRS